MLFNPSTFQSLPIKSLNLQFNQFSPCLHNTFIINHFIGKSKFTPNIIINLPLINMGFQISYNRMKSRMLQFISLIKILFLGYLYFNPLTSQGLPIKSLNFQLNQFGPSLHNISITNYFTEKSKFTLIINSPIYPS